MYHKFSGPHFLLGDIRISQPFEVFSSLFFTKTINYMGIDHRNVRTVKGVAGMF